MGHPVIHSTTIDCNSCQEVRSLPHQKWYHVYDTKLYLIFQFWISGECGVPLHYHYLQVHTDFIVGHIFEFHLWLVGWFLWHIKLCRSFNTKSSLNMYQIYMVCKHSLLVTFLNAPKPISLLTVKWFQVFLSNMNNSILFVEITIYICTHTHTHYTHTYIYIYIYIRYDT